LGRSAAAFFGDTGQDNHRGFSESEDSKWEKKEEVKTE
jgi:hypothetical protein